MKEAESLGCSKSHVFILRFLVFVVGRIMPSAAIYLQISRAYECLTFYYKGIFVTVWDYDTKIGIIPYYPDRASVIVSIYIWREAEALELGRDRKMLYSRHLNINILFCGVGEWTQRLVNGRQTLCN